MPSRETKRRDLGLRIQIDPHITEATREHSSHAGTKSSVCGSQFLFWSLLLVVCTLIAVWGNIVDFMSYRHRAHLNEYLQQLDIDIELGENSGSLDASKKPPSHIMVRKLPPGTNPTLTGDSDILPDADFDDGDQPRAHDGNVTTDMPKQPTRGRSDYCECRSECYQSTDGSWCYLKTSSCKLIQPCAKMDASDFCISFGPGGPSTRCKNIHNPTDIGQRTPVDHFNLPLLSSSVVPRAKAVAPSSSGREHAIVQKVYLEEAMAEELGHGILDKRNNLFLKTSRGRSKIVPQMNITASKRTSGNVKHLDFHDLTPFSARKVVRGPDGKLHVIESDAHEKSKGQIEDGKFDLHNSDGATSGIQWLEDLDLGLDDEHVVEVDAEATDPDDDEDWHRLWFAGDGSFDSVGDSHDNHDGIYEPGSLPSLPCHLMLGETKPCNLLFIMSDQHRHDYLGAVEVGTATISPVLDHFMDLGATFSEAVTYVPVCVPSRASLLTGMSAEANGITSGDDMEIPFNSQTFSQALAMNGYITGYFGKWHNSNEDIAAFNSTPWGRKYLQHSFNPIVEESQVYRRWLGKKHPAQPPKDGELLHRKAGWGWPYQPLLEFDDELILAKSKKTSYKALPQWALFGIQDIPADVSMSQYTALQAAKAIHDFTRKNPESPFAVTVSFQKPHPPMLVGRDFWLDSDVASAIPPRNWQDQSLKFPYTKHKNGGDKDMLAEFLQSSENHIKILVALYKAAVREVDSAIGVLINTLKQIGIEHNTLIVYTSDHGSMLGSHGLMGKSTLYEEAVRVPLLMKLPHVIPADTKIKHPVTLLDVAPTVLDYLLGSTAMKKFDTHGQSVRPLIERKPPNSWQRYAAVSLKDGRWYMVRTRKWKMIWDGQVEEASGLYNLFEDPFELHNFISLEGDGGESEEDDDSFSNDFDSRKRRRMSSGKRTLDAACKYCSSMLRRMSAFLQRWRHFAIK